MAGHSKWANIQHRKNAQDAKRGAVFTKLIREITVAARLGGEVLGTNARLRLAVDKALSANMPKDKIERAIKRGAGGLEGQNLEEIRYEGYGPGGAALLVECMTDNKNRTVSEVRHVFARHGGNLGTDGSVAYLFSKKGQLLFGPGYDEQDILEVALEAGADDVITHEDGSIEVLTDPEYFAAVQQALVDKKFMPEHTELSMLASVILNLDVEASEKMSALVYALEELDDVQNVYSNTRC